MPDPQLALQVAELFWVPCVAEPNEDFNVVCIGGKLSIDGQGHLPHKTCGGTGKLWPLREPCPNSHEYPIDRLLGLCCCQSRRWLPHVSYGALVDAVRARGWRFRVTQCGDGDMVEQWALNPPGDLGDWVVLVYSYVGLRNEDALCAALVRALEKENV